MPYASTNELPASVKSHLPVEAQHIFLEAFNNAFHEYENADESTAFKVAWSAVKKTYEKHGEHWIKKHPVASRTIL